MAYGITLEVGAGDGNQLSRYDPTKVIRVVGVEPNEFLIARLEERLALHGGLAGKYLAVQTALEDTAKLEQLGITERSVDSIVCMQVLCSVQDCRAAATIMHKLLKPGGQLLFWEHCASADPVTTMVQRLWNLVWTPSVGGCHLNRSILEAIHAAGSWTIDEVGHDSQGPYDLMPRVWGRFTKDAVP